MTDRPVADLSIVVPNFNNGRFLPEFLNSIIASTMLPGEVIVVDDGSKDDSAEVLRLYQHLDFLKVVVLPENKGLPSALNAGIEMASGKYIMRADPDDLLMPERIERQYGFMESHPDIAVLGCNAIYFHHETGKNLNVSNFPTVHEEILRGYQRGVNSVQHPTAIIRRSALAGYRYGEICPGEDYQLFSTMARDGCRFANLPEPLYRMRIHPASSTSNISLSAVRNIFLIRDRLWNTHTREIRIRRYYFYIVLYRKSQLTGNPILRYILMVIAGLFFPTRLIKRLL